MLARLEIVRPYALALTVPVTLLWTAALGPFLGSLVVAAHAAAVLFLSAWWVREDLARGLHPRLGLARDRFAIDRDDLDLAASLLGLLTATLVLTLVIAAPAIGLFAAVLVAAGLWNASLRPSRRYAMIEVITPVALLIGPAALLRAPAWRGEPAAISAAAHAAAWLVGAMLLTQLLIAMTRDRERDRAAGVVTTAAKLSRPAAIATITAALAALTLLAGLGAPWWTAAPAVLLGWTSTAVVALLCVRWDDWAAGAAATGFGLTAIVTAAQAI